MSTYFTLRGLMSQGVEAEILCYPLSEGGRLRGEDVTIHYASRPLESKFGLSLRLVGETIALGSYDLYHAQGVWQYPTYVLVNVARRRGRPYIITPRGMLYPQDIIKSNRCLKELSLRWKLLRDLNAAAAIHVTCFEEMQHCRELGVVSPIAVIPNPVEVSVCDVNVEDGRFILGYMGRLSARKRVEMLIYAFADLKCEDAELLIIGGGDERYERFLRSEVERLCLNNVRFVGFLSGEEKANALSSLSVLAMPSEFENLGNVILEGLERGIPCIATKGSPWEELEAWRCGWWVENSQRAITEAIDQAIKLPRRELREMGGRGRQLIVERYSVETIACRMKWLYEWVLGRADRPDFVYEKGGERSDAV